MYEKYTFLFIDHEKMVVTIKINKINTYILVFIDD